MRRDASPFGALDDDIDEPVYQSEYELCFLKETVVIKTLWKAFPLNLHRGNDFHLEITIDFDDVNHREVMRSVQELVHNLQDQCWTVSLGGWRG